MMMARRYRIFSTLRIVIERTVDALAPCRPPDRPQHVFCCRRSPTQATRRHRRDMAKERILVAIVGRLSRCPWRVVNVLCKDRDAVPLRYRCLCSWSCLESTWRLYSLPIGIADDGGPRMLASKGVASGVTQVKGLWRRCPS